MKSDREAASESRATAMASASDNTLPEERVAADAGSQIAIEASNAEANRRRLEGCR
jgi:hypothetical protein